MKFKREIQVRDIDGPDAPRLEFVSDTQDVEYIEDILPRGQRGKYDSFFTLAEDGEYVLVYGMHGIIPNVDKRLTKVYGSVSSANLLNSIGRLNRNT